MTRRVDPRLAYELKRFGAVGVEQCIGCGNCTAICPMARDGGFPRRLVRMVQLGLEDDLLGSKEPWLCFNCGECSETCPQGAEPGNLMAAARSYAIARYAPLRIGDLFFRRPLVGAGIAAALVLLFALFLYAQRRAMATGSLQLFGFVPYTVIHLLGLVVIALVALAGLVTIVTMVSRVARAPALPAAEPAAGARPSRGRALWTAVVVQSLGQQRYRQDCDARPGGPWVTSKWFVHAATMWGFLGMLAATGLDYLLAVVGVKATGTLVPLWYPTRLLGTLAGLAFIYGVSVLLCRRWRATDKSHAFSRASDWLFLTLLWLSAATGFVVEIALYLPGAPVWGYWLFVVHVAVSITLVLLFPFTKFAHAFYRIVALYLDALRPVPGQEAATRVD